MKSIIIIEVEHTDSTDGVAECLFDLGIGSQVNPHGDPEWPTARDGASWPRVIPGGIDYRVTDYTVRVDVPGSLVLDSDMPSVADIYKSCAATPKVDLLDDPWRQKNAVRVPVTTWDETGTKKVQRY